MIENIDYHLIDKCNLNCKACGHFSPLAKNNSHYVTFDQAKQELDALARITNYGQHINWLTLTGGEIGLNPDLALIASYAFKLFGNKLRLWTNGLAPHKLDCIKDIVLQGATLHITNYAQRFTENAFKHFTEVGIPFKYIDHKDKTQIDFNVKFFSRDRVANNDHALNCEARHYCTQYKDYKIYPCQYLAYSKYFNEHFKDDPFKLDDQCYIDIRMFDSWSQIEYFIKNRISWTCYHCREAAGITNTEPWDISKSDISEWVAD